jgi:hypothetical protein
MVHRVRVKDQIKSLVAAAVICLFPAMILAPVTIAQEKTYDYCSRCQGGS